jgi:hypothetical protein
MGKATKRFIVPGPFALGLVLGLSGARTLMIPASVRWAVVCSVQEQAQPLGLRPAAERVLPPARRSAGLLVP